ncbi:MAG: ATPase [Bacteroidetes bacterium 4572_77]|nr:MAG: ATPase [Bacteroidetes bacterium 4572_77]
MILIADSGSTKTDWVLCNLKENKADYRKSIGLNPYFVNANDVADTLNNTFTKKELSTINQIFFYGAGCSSFKASRTILNGLKKSCHKASIEVSHDVLGAARALLGDNSGVIGILGTGSNACVYNGKEITKEGVSFGYIMGDEGSGNHLGRLLLKAIFTKKAPLDLQQAFSQAFPKVDLPLLLKHLYEYEFPNRYLASFSPFIWAQKEHTYMEHLIANSFDDYLQNFILQMEVNKDEELHFQGSVAWNYSHILRQSLKKRGLKCGRIIQAPIVDLLKYHCKKSTIFDAQ